MYLDGLGVAKRLEDGVGFEELRLKVRLTLGRLGNRRQVFDDLLGVFRLARARFTRAKHRLVFAVYTIAQY